MDGVKRTKLSELIQDPHNANKGTERGAEMVRQSITKLGAGRSILMDKNGVLIAGNKTQQAAIDAGLLDAIVVRTDGNQLVVVQRTDLDLSIDAKAKELAVVDNRSSEIGLEWDTEFLANLSHDVDLSDWFKDEELVDILTDMGDLEPPIDLSDGDDEEPPDSNPGGDRPIAVTLSWKDQQRWTALKAVLGLKRDQDAFLEAMDRLELML